MDDAFWDLVSIVGAGKKESAVKDKEAMVKGAIESVLTALGVKVPPVPEEIDDLHARLEYMLRPSGVMRRRVELVGEWWKETSGPLLGATKSGDVVAILPNALSGYSFTTPRLEKGLK